MLHILEAYSFGCLRRCGCCCLSGNIQAFLRASRYGTSLIDLYEQVPG
jgi:hypothetical protein